jgi:hypothetical protein
VAVRGREGQAEGRAFSGTKNPLQDFILFFGRFTVKSRFLCVALFAALEIRWRTHWVCIGKIIQESFHENSLHCACGDLGAGDVRSGRGR